MKQPCYNDFNYIGALTELIKKMRLKDQVISDLFKFDPDARKTIENKNFFKFDCEFEYKNQVFKATGEAFGKKQDAKRLAAKNCLIQFLDFLRKDHPIDYLDLGIYGLTEKDFPQPTVVDTETPTISIDQPLLKSSLLNLDEIRNKATYNGNPFLDEKLDDEKSIENLSIQLAKSSEKEVTLSKLNEKKGLFSKPPTNSTSFNRTHLNQVQEISSNSENDSANQLSKKKVIQLDSFTTKKSKLYDFKTVENQINLLDKEKPIVKEQTEEAIDFLNKNKKIILSILEKDTKKDKGQVIEELIQKFPLLRLKFGGDSSEIVWLKLFYKETVLQMVYDDNFDSIQKSFKNVYEKLYYSIRIAIG